MLVKMHFVPNCVGDFGLLLRILGFYWITGNCLLDFEPIYLINKNK